MGEDALWSVLHRHLRADYNYSYFFLLKIAAISLYTVFHGFAYVDYSIFVPEV